MAVLPRRAAPATCIAVLRTHSRCRFSADAPLVYLRPRLRPVAQRSALTSDQKTILAALDLPEPPKYLDFTPGINAAVPD
jgi:hypothetical protein